MDMNWSQIWESIKTFFTSNFWSIIIFFASLLIGIILIKILMNILKHILNSSKMEKIAQHFLLMLTKFCLCLVLILILMNIIGIELTGILTAISALMLAVGLSLQNSIANLADGIILISNHMFKKGDYIIVDGKEGSITEINFLFTTLMTIDNKKITLPNSILVNNSVVNAGANPRRRVDFTFSVAYETDVNKVKDIVLSVMKSDGRVYLDPAPFCKLKSLSASSIDFFANCWCDNEDYWDIYYYVIENVYNEFKRNKVSIPYSQIEVRSRTDKVVMPYMKAPLPQRVEKIRKKEEKKIDAKNMDLVRIFKGKKKQDKKDPKEEAANTKN